MEKKLTGYARFKPLQDELAALKAENERHLADKRKLVSDVLQLQADKAELLEFIKEVEEWKEDYSSTYIRIRARQLLSKHEAK